MKFSYQTYQPIEDMIAPIRMAASSAIAWRNWVGGIPGWPLDSSWGAMLDLVANTKMTHKRPPFAIHEVLCGNRLLAVREEVALSLPFCDLLHFAKDDSVAKPKVLVVAPLSGPFATLLRNTVHTLLRDHDVYITDWVNARDVPLSAGPFAFDDYVSYLIRFFEELGPGANAVAVCQPCVQTIAAVAVMAEDNHPCQRAR